MWNANDYDGCNVDDDAGVVYEDDAYDTCYTGCAYRGCADMSMVSTVMIVVVAVMVIAIVMI